MSKVTKFVVYFSTTKLQALLIILIFVSLGRWGSDNYKNYLNPDTSLPSWNKPKPLEKYTIENLSQTEVKPTEVKIEDNIFSFNFDPTLQNKLTKKVTGMINTPEGTGPFPIVVLIRGYVDQSIYHSGAGTKRVGEYFVDNKYITLAPDFLGSRVLETIATP